MRQITRQSSSMGASSICATTSPASRSHNPNPHHHLSMSRRLLIRRSRPVSSITYLELATAKNPNTMVSTIPSFEQQVRMLGSMASI